MNLPRGCPLGEVGLPSRILLRTYDTPLPFPRPHRKDTIIFSFLQALRTHRASRADYFNHESVVAASRLSRDWRKSFAAELGAVAPFVVSRLCQPCGFCRADDTKAAYADTKLAEPFVESTKMLTRTTRPIQGGFNGVSPRCVRPLVSCRCQLRHLLAK